MIVLDASAAVQACLAAGGFDLFGNERLIAALARIKSYLDYGAFTPIQVAAAAALNGPQDCIDEIRATYKRRRDCLVDALTLGASDPDARHARQPRRVRDRPQFRHHRADVRHAGDATS